MRRVLVYCPGALALSLFLPLSLSPAYQFLHSICYQLSLFDSLTSCGVDDEASNSITILTEGRENSTSRFCNLNSPIFLLSSHKIDQSQSKQQTKLQEDGAARLSEVRNGFEESLSCLDFASKL